MVYLVLIVGVVNLVLGLALAIYLETIFPPPATSIGGGKKLRWLAWKQPDGGGTAGGSAFPAAWIALFEQQRLSPRNPYEALLLALRFQTDGYRRRLLELQDQIRFALSNHDQDRIGSLLDQLRELSRFWSDVRGEAMAYLEKQGNRFGRYRENVNPLEGLLMEQQAGVESVANMVAQSALDADKKGSMAMIVNEMSRLIDFVYRMRDTVEQYLAQFYRSEKKLLHLEPALLSDLQLDIFNRVGLEAEFDRRWHKVPDFEMIVSAIIVDLWNCEKLNQQYGRLVVDRVIAGLTEIIGCSTRKDHRADLPARIDGHTFVVILRDADLKGALSVAERIRQTAEKSTFHTPDGPMPVSVVCGAMRLDESASIEMVLEQLDALNRFAKEGGKSRTVLMQDDQMSEHPVEEVPVRSIRFDCG